MGIIGSHADITSATERHQAIWPDSGIRDDVGEFLRFPGPDFAGASADSLPRDARLN